MQTRIKADRDCASVAAASVIAKVHRDRLMIDADAVTPGYGWAGNKGYGSAEHFAAIAELGPTRLPPAAAGCKSATRSLERRADGSNAARRLGLRRNG